MICTELQVFCCRSGAPAAIGSGCRIDPIGPRAGLLQMSRRRGGAIVGAAPSPRSAPDVVSTQSARGRASYRCTV